MARGNAPSRGNFWQTVGLTLLAAVTVTLCFLALTRDVSGSAVVSDAGSQPSATPTASDPTADPTAGTPSSSATPSSDAAPAQDPPTVKDLRNADFTTGADLPDGARTFDNPSVGGPIELTDAGLTHGAPTGPEALSSLETELAGPVQKLSARVLFAADDPGSVVLVAWQDSLVDARSADEPVPASGLRLVASADSWQLTSYEKTPAVLAQGTFAAVDGPATFTVTRADDIAWVEDPAGTTTQVQDPRIASLAGPWACWQLYEKTAAETPAVIEAVSAG